MANLTATRVTGLTAEPRTIIPRGLVASPRYVIKDTIAIGTANLTLNDAIYLTEVPFNAKIDSIVIFNDDLDSNGTPLLTANIGLYSLNDAGTFTVLSATAYASAITTLQSANTLGVNVAFEQRDIINIGKTVFEDAGLTAEPTDSRRAILTLVVSAAAATAAAGDLTFVVTYTM